MAVKPQIIAYSSKMKTKCGEIDTRNASYCGADQNIYYASDLMSTFPERFTQGQTFLIETVLAHEFGHSVQGRAGILLSVEGYKRASPDLPRAEYSRRLELQADCFAGEFVGSVRDAFGLTGADITRLAQAFAVNGDEKSPQPPPFGAHGLGMNRQQWFTNGAQNPQLSVCNIYLANSEVQ